MLKDAAEKAAAEKAAAELSNALADFMYKCSCAPYVLRCGQRPAGDVPKMCRRCAVDVPMCHKPEDVLRVSIQPGRTIYFASRFGFDDAGLPQLPCTGVWPKCRNDLSEIFYLVLLMFYRDGWVSDYMIFTPESTQLCS